jgi:gliding motility-associated-like protein
LLTYTPTNYIATLDMKAPDNVTTDICNTNTISDIKERNTRPVFGMTFCDAPGKPFAFTWYPGTLLSDSNIRQPLTYVPRTTTYQVATLGKNGCKVADTLQVYVPVHNFSVWPADTSICYGQSVPLEVRNGNDYQWFEYEEGQYKPSFKSLSCDYCANPVAKPLKSTHYKIMVGDEVFCYDTIDAYIEVRPLPQVHILTPDTVVKYGHSVQLLVNGAKMYNWTPVSSLNNPNISYPLATPTEPTMYVVSGISATGCYSYDTVRVGIDYRDNLNIPTAFSPNGDGKNDVFRVTNITFQKIVEFRVFNRWGQEVYNGGGDSGAGWDGNWKGVPQEIGDYNYLVRVSSPDGLVETYKGNVTVVR